MRRRGAGAGRGRALKSRDVQMHIAQGAERSRLRASVSKSEDESESEEGKHGATASDAQRPARGRIQKRNIQYRDNAMVMRMRLQQGPGPGPKGERLHRGRNQALSACAAAAAAAVLHASIALASSTSAGGTVAACQRYLSPPRIGSYSPFVTRLPANPPPMYPVSDSSCSRPREEKGSKRRRGQERTFPVQNAVRAPSDVSVLGRMQADLLDVPIARCVLCRGGRCGGGRGDGYGEALGGPAGGVHARADAVVRQEGEQARQRDRHGARYRHRAVAG